MQEVKDFEYFKNIALKEIDSRLDVLTRNSLFISELRELEFQFIAYIQSLPLPEGVELVGSYISLYSGTNLYITLSVLSFQVISDYLQTIEEEFGIELESRDNPSDGTRVFLSTMLGYKFCLQITCYPSDAAGATCRRVVVGQDTKSMQVPVYKIICG
jgi:hypothetical protein